MLKKTISVLVLIFFGTSILNFAQNAKGSNISGQVLDLNESKPLEFANIVLFNKSDSSQITGGITNPEGYFSLENVKPGNYYLRISFIGYVDEFIDDVSIKQNTNFDLGEIYLAPQTFGIKDVVVEGTRAPITYEIDKKIINVSEQLTSLSGTAVDVLENVPSVTVDIDGNVSLRGSGSFQVLIDGRPTILDASEALQQIPASTIENLEIITNPSAKYDPEGTAGIINVVMKKSEQKGISGVLDLDGSLSHRYGIEGLFDYKNNVFHGTFSVDYSDRMMETSSEDYNWTMREGLTSYVSSNGNGNRGREFFSLRGSAAFNLSDNDVLSFGGRYRDRDMAHSSTDNYEEWTSNDPLRIFYLSNSDRSRGGYQYSGFANFKHKFGPNGHELTADINYEYDNSDEATLTELVENGIIVNGRKTTESGPGTEIESKLDYTLPLGEDSKFEAGYEGESEVNDERTGMSIYDPNASDYLEDARFSNHTKYNKNEYAVYSLYSNKISDIGFQLGLRAEYTYRNIEVESESNAFKIDRWDYFPTAHFSYEFAQGHQLMTNYTRRINRPRGWELEPFQTWIDAYNIRVGNPALNPEYIDSYELGYQTFFGKSLFSIEAYYRVTNNKIERVRSVYDANITLSSVENVGKDYSLGTELFLNFDPADFWNVNLMGNLYDYRVEGALSGQDFSASSFNWNVRFNNQFKIGKNTQLQFNAFYNSPTVYSQGRREGFFFTNFAVKQDFFDKTLSATLQIRDIFGTVQWERIYESVDFYNYMLGSRESPIVMLNVRLNFNNYRQDRRDGAPEGGGMGMDGDEF
ncbi:MAG: TonB-dependent receptor family protein [Melioribacteraceae bacterium]|nr:TonB-dependent receptor family protein [Melioribacteraceae bacterium]